MSDVSLEDLVIVHEQAKTRIEELEAEQKVIKDELLDRLKQMKLTGTKTKNGYYIKRILSSIYSGVELPTARELGAVFSKEAIDVNMLRKLDEKGVKIKGKRIVEYVRVDEDKK